MHDDKIQIVYTNLNRQHIRPIKACLPLIFATTSISTAQAALVSPCAGVSLPPSIVTNIVGAAVLPVTSVLDSGLSILLGPLGLNSNLNTTLASIAAGDPINLNVLDEDGNVVSPAEQCDTSSDSFQLDTPKGISIGGNKITGLGNGPEANAGELNSIAFGNNAVTNAAALNSIAIGTNSAIGAQGTNSVALGSNSSVTVGNSVALGAGSSATTGAQTNYTALGLDSPQTSVGEVSVGSAGNERKITNVAAGSSDTDAVNVSQLAALDDLAVKYDADPLNLKMSVTLAGPTSTDGGVTNGTKITNLAQGDVSEFSTDAVNGAQLYALDNNAVKYDADPLNLKMSVTLEGPTSTDGGVTNGTKITNLAQGTVTALSTDAINGAQLFNANTNVANTLGGGASVDPVTGNLQAPSYSIFGSNYNNVGSAFDALQLNAPVQFSDINGVPTPNTITNHITLVGGAPGPVTIHNVADGVAPNDAVNVSQLQDLATDVDTLDTLAVKYDDLSLDTVTLGGATSTDGGTTGGTRITNLARGDVSALSTDAVNGSQLFALTNDANFNNDALGNSAAFNFGGGATYNPTTGIISAPTYIVYGSNYNNVGSAITALQANSPLQYSDSNGNATPNPVSNDVTLVGPTAGPVRIHNVADGVADTDAVNVRQLQDVADNVSNLDQNAVKYDNASKDTVTFGGTTSTDGGVNGGTLLTNLHAGTLSATSTDAVNGAQLYATDQLIKNFINNNRSIKFFQVNSTAGDSNATGTDAMAIGPLAIATGNDSIAMGHNSQATADGAIALGLNSESSGVNAIAIGTGAVATGSVAVGAGAQAGNGGAAFGDNAVALVPQQGTAIGNAATVTSDRGVAIGAGSTATRAGMNGATERFSGVAVNSTEGAVSVGSAGNERQITNVAGGTADTDAVNVRQLESAIAQSNVDITNQLYSLRSDISTVRHDAYGGTASAMAMASMPQSTMPGKAMMSAGIASYQGQSAVSMGISNFSENGRWMFNVNGSANTRGHAGVAAGVGFHW